MRDPSPSWSSWLSLATALAVLNVCLTFQNVWPTPAVTWTGGLSIELSVCLLLLGVLGFMSARVPTWLVRTLAGLGVVLVLGRYAVVTSPALFGRDVNLYWDLRFVPDVAAMLVRPASWLVTIAAVLAIVGVPYGIYRLLRWALTRVARAVIEPKARLAVLATSLAIVGLFTWQRSLEATDEWQGYQDHRLFGTVDFPPPVSVTYANQIRVLAKQLSGEAARAIGPGPTLDASLAAADGADVFVFFVESYGAITFDRPAFNSALEPHRRALAAAVEATGQEVLSGFVESPTFGGGSWLAHISLLTGIDVRDEDTNQVLLAQKRDSLVTTFSRRGYRTVAIMPGLQRDWPEGSFYGFDDIYGESRLGYKGPQFGWWVVPDQFSLYQLNALELNAAPRPPVFAFMAGVSTHTPFSPTAPYQPDWSRLPTKFPYPPADIDAAYDYPPDWLNLGPSYVRAMQYVYQSISGYVRESAGRESVIVVLGDHQPPALVSGLGAPWDVPAHIITRRQSVLRALEAKGFKRGVEVARPVIGKMHQLTPILLEALSGSQSPSGAEPDRAPGTTPPSPR